MILSIAAGKTEEQREKQRVFAQVSRSNVRQSLPGHIQYVEKKKFINQFVIFDQCSECFTSSYLDVTVLERMLQLTSQVRCNASFLLRKRKETALSFLIFLTDTQKPFIICFSQL